MSRRRRRFVALILVVNLASLGLFAVAVAVALSTVEQIPDAPGDLRHPPPLGSRITFTTPAEAAERRSRLRRYVFGGPGLPQGQPSVTRGVGDTGLDDLDNLARIDRLTIVMPLGFTSVAYHLVPRQANRRLLLYHNGHRQNLDEGEDTIAHFLDLGYAVLVFAMPFTGLNENPDQVETRCGLVTVRDLHLRAVHDTLACLPRPIRYFVEPIAVALNYAEQLDYELTAMVGLSGGGWTTMLYAALDPRLQRSYPVAGSRPHYVTARTCSGRPPRYVSECFGDFEQRDPGLFGIANHLELYALGGWGANRRQLAITNVYDSCCWGGESYLEWRPLVQASLRRLGPGGFGARGDKTHRDHLISEFALGLIESDLERP